MPPSARSRDATAAQTGNRKYKRRRNEADLAAVDAILASALRVMLDNSPFLPKDDSTLGRYLAQHGTVEKARAAMIDTHNWRVYNGIDSLLWTWPRHPGARETAMRHYWPARIMSSYAHDGSLVRYLKVSSIDWRGIVQLGLVDVVFRQVLYMAEKAACAMPGGEHYLIYDFGHSDEDVLAGRAVPIDFMSVVTVWRDILPLLRQHYPKLVKRFVFVRTGLVISAIATTMAMMSQFLPDIHDHPADFHADSGLPELLKLMPPDAIPRDLGGAGGDVLGTGGYLLAPERPCLLPWLPRPAEPRLWSLQEAQAQQAQQASAPGPVTEGEPAVDGTSWMSAGVTTTSGTLSQQTPVLTPATREYAQAPSTLPQVVKLEDALCDVDSHGARAVGDDPAERPRAPAGSFPGTLPGAASHGWEYAGTGLAANTAVAGALEDDNNDMDMDISAWFEQL